MRQFAFILSFCIIIQISFATSLKRVKRNDFASNDPKVYYRSTKALVQKFNPIVKTVLMNLPESPELNSYKHNLITYLEKSEESAAKKGVCFVKTFQQLEDFIELLMPLRYGTNGPENRVVMDLFNQHGYKDLEKDFENFVEGYNVEEFMKQVDKLSEAEDYELLEEC